LAGSSIAKEGRTYHLGIDIFSHDLEPVFAPCDGEIVRVGREPEDHSFGNYVILRSADGSLPLFFFGHLGFELPQPGPVSKGQVIGRLGDYTENENGGWSRHLHLQCLSKLPPKSVVPPGYAAKSDFLLAKSQYPDPLQFFSDWKLAVVA
jgi:hypothetical protein